MEEPQHESSFSAIEKGMLYELHILLRTNREHGKGEFRCRYPNCVPPTCKRYRDVTKVNTHMANHHGWVQLYPKLKTHRPTELQDWRGYYVQWLKDMAEDVPEEVHVPAKRPRKCKIRERVKYGASEMPSKVHVPANDVTGIQRVQSLLDNMSVRFTQMQADLKYVKGWLSAHMDQRDYAGHGGHVGHAGHAGHGGHVDYAGHGGHAGHVPHGGHGGDGPFGGYAGGHGGDSPFGGYADGYAGGDGYVGGKGLFDGYAGHGDGYAGRKVFFDVYTGPFGAHAGGKGPFGAHAGGDGYAGGKGGDGYAGGKGPLGGDGYVGGSPSKRSPHVSPLERSPRVSTLQKLPRVSPWEKSPHVSPLERSPRVSPLEKSPHVSPQGYVGKGPFDFDSPLNKENHNGHAKEVAAVGSTAGHAENLPANEVAAVGSTAGHAENLPANEGGSTAGPAKKTENVENAENKENVENAENVENKENVENAGIGGGDENAGGEDVKKNVVDLTSVQDVVVGGVKEGICILQQVTEEEVRHLEVDAWKDAMYAFLRKEKRHLRTPEGTLLQLLPEYEPMLKDDNSCMNSNCFDVLFVLELSKPIGSQKKTCFIDPLLFVAPTDKFSRAWTKHVVGGLENFDMVCLPIVYWNHWSLVVIFWATCNECKRELQILQLDSLNSSQSRLGEARKHLNSFLKLHEDSSRLSCIPWQRPKVPKQPPGSNLCGWFTLFYISIMRASEIGELRKQAEKKTVEQFFAFKEETLRNFHATLIKGARNCGGESSQCT